MSDSQQKELKPIQKEWRQTRKSEKWLPKQTQNNLRHSRKSIKITKEIDSLSDGSVLLIIIWIIREDSGK